MAQIGIGQGCGHRGTRFHSGWSRGARPQVRLRADPQARQAAARNVRVAYSLEYGVDEMEMHKDAIRAGEKVLLIDDLIATGGTATGAASLLQWPARGLCRLFRHRSSGSGWRGASARRRHIGAIAAHVLNLFHELPHLRADCRRVAWRLVLAEVQSRCSKRKGIACAPPTFRPPVLTCPIPRKSRWKVGRASWPM